MIAPVLRELALAQRLADSQLLRWFLHEPEHAVVKSQLFRELEGYRHAFADHSYFFIDHSRLAYFYNDATKVYSEEARYFLNQNDVNDQWYFVTLNGTADFNINVDPDVHLGVTKVWFNIIVKDNHGQRIGMAGTGLDLSHFVNNFVNSEALGVESVLIDPEGAIQAHKNIDRIQYSAFFRQNWDKNFFSLLENSNDQQKLRTALQFLKQHPEQSYTFEITQQAQTRIIALAFMPELN